MAFEIKDEFKDERVGFNKSAEPLGKRKDLHLLAEVALHPDGTVKDSHVINYFKEIPTHDQIKAAKEQEFNQKQTTKAAVATTSQTNGTSTAK